MTKFSLITAINEADEEGFLTRVKNKILGKKPEDKAEDKAKDPDKEEKVAQSEPEEKSPDIDNSTPLYAQFVEKIRRSKSGTDRVVLRMTHSDLTNLYLKGGENGAPSKGGIEFVKALPDDVIKGIAKYPAHTDKIKAGKNLFGVKVSADVQALPRGYSFSQLITSPDSSHDMTVLLDIPSNLMAELAKAGKSADVNAARAALSKMMNHKYYVMTLSNDRSKKVASKIDAAFGSLDASIDAIPPSIVQAYPNLRELKQIRTEWANGEKAREQSASKQTKADEPDADTAATLARAKDNMDKIVHGKGLEKDGEAPKAEPAAPAEEPKTAAPSGEDFHSLLGSGWEKYVQSIGGMGENNRVKNQKKIPQALRQQIYKMAQAVGYNP